MEKTDLGYTVMPWHKRWYAYNKQKIPMIFTLIGTFFFTALIDFEIQGTDIKLQSHIAAIRQFLNTPYNNMSAFYLFAIYLIGIVQLFNSFSFSKKRSPFGLILLTFLTVAQCVLVGLYTSIFFLEQATRDDYVIDSIARFSFTVFIVGAVFFVIGTIFAWFYVDWKYVKEIDE
jgi:hypothetical protein